MLGLSVGKSKFFSIYGNIFNIQSHMYTHTHIIKEKDVEVHIHKYTYICMGRQMGGQVDNRMTIRWIESRKDGWIDEKTGVKGLKTDG